MVTLACKTAVRLNDGDVQVDPQLMFQRLSIVATTGGFESPQQFFEYEMCSFPASLFDASLLPLKANKPVLADAIWSAMTKESQTANDPGRSAYLVLIFIMARRCALISGLLSVVFVNVTFNVYYKDCLATQRHEKSFFNAESKLLSNSGTLWKAGANRSLNDGEQFIIQVR